MIHLALVLMWAHHPWCFTIRLWFTTALCLDITDLHLWLLIVMTMLAFAVVAAASDMKSASIMAGVTKSESMVAGIVMAGVATMMTIKQALIKCY